MKEEWEKQFDKVFNKARGEHNIVGDLMIKDFVRKALTSQKQEILDEIELEIKERYYDDKNAGSSDITIGEMFERGCNSGYIQCVNIIKQKR